MCSHGKISAFTLAFPSFALQSFEEFRSQKGRNVTLVETKESDWVSITFR